MLQPLKEKVLEVIKTIVPLVTLICVLQFTVVRAPTPQFLQFLAGSLMAIAGLTLFFMGIDTGMLPMGRFIGAELPQRGSLTLILAIAFLLGFVTTVAEPDVLVLSRQVDTISLGVIQGNTITYVTAAGVGLFVAIAMLRIILGFRMVYLLAGAYSVIILLSFFTPAEFVSLAYDSGSVTTGALTAPVIIALTLGITSALTGRSNVSDGFGLLGLASIGPIVVVMIMGILI